MTSKILVFAGSYRSGSVNTRLAGAITKELAKHNCDVTWISLADYQLPIYDGDLEAADGVPENAKKLAALFDANNAFFVVSPEYNGSVTPLLKNTLDWVSRVKEVEGTTVQPFKGKTAALAACSPGKLGGISSLSHLRDILIRLGVLVISEQIAVGNAGSAFDDQDELTDERTAGFLSGACTSLVDKSRY